ncbi:MAG: peptidylprolyl isomerase [Oceanicoccus sp.]|uniref:SurA N-terminal domain-containing protein n=1 Tax=Oceanicoccus sp. TaxID=2691044 RepID=UPI00262DD990|nr:SurA N-terminal domain-containing protein [Oceanicoccus sp.]MCP3906777.1 peptidylprolyl isomerase [Oceanicoccus sp.]
MLQNIRNNSQGLVAKFIIGLIIIPFALFGIDSLVGGGGPANVATVNGEDITLMELDQAMNLERRRLLNRMGENADPSLLTDELLRGPVLERLIQQHLLMQAASDESVVVSATAIDQAIVNMSQFQENGQFSPQLYQNILRSNGYTPSYFKQMMSDEMASSQLNAGIAGSAFVTEAELEQVASIVGQQRSFRYFILPKAKVAAQVQVTDAEVQAYYDANIDSFQSEDQVKLEYIELKQQDFFKPVSDEDLQRAYAEDIESFNSQEERRVSHILIELSDDRDEAEARAIIESLMKKLDNGDDFGALATEFSDDRGSARNGGDLGYTQGDTFPEEFETALAELDVDQVSAPVLTDAGFHLIKATEIKQGDKPSFDDRKPILAQRIQLAAAEADFIKAVENLRDLVFNSEGLSSPAKELSVDVKQSALIGRASATGTLANTQVLAAAFSTDVLEDGNNSEVLELATDHFIVVNVLKHQPPAAKPLSDVKAGIVAQLSATRSTELALKLAEDSLAALSAGSALEAVAKAGDYEWQVQQNINRNNVAVDPGLLSAVFAMPAVSDGAVVNKALSLSNGDVAVVQLEEVEDGSWKQFSIAEQRGLKSELERNSSARSISGFLNMLRENAEITIL